MSERPLTPEEVQSKLEALLGKHATVVSDEEKPPVDVADLFESLAPGAKRVKGKQAKK